MSEVVTCYVVTGNLTGEGAVAYLRSDGSWTTTLGEAHAFDDEGAAEEGLARSKVAEDVITEPYAFRAERAGDEIRPLSARERLRAGGPSTRLRRPDRAARAS